MLILFQDGETEINSILPFRIHISADYGFELSKNPISWDVLLIQDNHLVNFGTFDSLDAAKLVIQRFTKAYERGDMAFRVK